MALIGHFLIKLKKTLQDLNFGGMVTSNQIVTKIFGIPALFMVL
jgi:hypothetical protein